MFTLSTQYTFLTYFTHFTCFTNFTCFTHYTGQTWDLGLRNSVLHLGYFWFKEFGIYGETLTCFQVGFVGKLLYSAEFNITKQIWHVCTFFHQNFGECQGKGFNQSIRHYSTFSLNKHNIQSLAVVNFFKGFLSKRKRKIAKNLMLKELGNLALTSHARE